MLNIFIDRFVLCPKCHLPETALAISLKKGMIYHKCSACGSKEAVDLSHKLCTYILKQAELAAASAKADEVALKEKKEKKDKSEKGEKVRPPSCPDPHAPLARIGANAMHHPQPSHAPSSSPCRRRRRKRKRRRKRRRRASPA
jgi:hypothetical protein